MSLDHDLDLNPHEMLAQHHMQSLQITRETEAEQQQQQIVIPCESESLTAWKLEKIIY